MNEIDRKEINEEYGQAAEMNLRLVFYLLTALNSAGYIAYVLVFVQLFNKAGVESWVPIFFLAFSLIGEALLEIPTGIVADRFGYKKSVLLSFVFLGLHSLFYLAAVLIVFGDHYDATTFYLLAGSAELLFALGTALQTGSLNSWFVVNLQHLSGKPRYLHKYMGRKRLVTNIVWLVVGSIILLIPDPKAQLITAFICGLVCYSISVAVTYFLALSRPNQATPKVHSSTLYKFMREELNGAVSEILRDRKLIAITVTHAIFWPLGVILLYFWQEILNIKRLDENGTLGLPFAVAWLLMGVSRIMGAKLSERVSADRIEGVDSRTTDFIIGQLFLSVPILFIFADFRSFGWTDIVTLGAVLLAISRMGQEFSKPISMAWTHEEIKNNRFRATTESLIEATAGFVIALAAIPLYIWQLNDKSTNHTESGPMIKMVLITLAVAVLIINIPITWLIVRNNHKKS